MATMMVISIFLRPLLVFQVASCFLNVPLIHHKTVPSSSAMMMVRNIDLAEAIIFYGHGSLFQDRNELLPGVEYLLQECERDDTVVLAILETTTNISNLPSTIQVRPETQAPPNPRDLWEAIHSLQVQPKGFGGSSGFGTKAADPERPPLPQHCVVLCHNEDQCRAARYAGMRVLCLTDNDFADGILLDWESICMDDIATPGSFWLNPPHPRDDESNGVDPELVMETYENSDNTGSQRFGKTTRNRTLERIFGNADDGRDDSGDDLSDDQLAAMLADMDSL